jgi:hypothetical protein
MSTHKLLATAFLSTLCACGTASTGGGTNTMSSPLVGSWLSAGSDVAPLLAGAPFKWTKITADFKADQSYVVTGLDADGKTTVFTGTYMDAPTEVPQIWSIAVTQSAPASTLADGIYQIDASAKPARMRYEVVQTQPTNGLQPPTPQAGFGSTVYNGMKISSLIQNFVRQ